MPRRTKGYWIEAHRTSGIYRICWTENRAKRTKSIGTRNKEEAEQYLVEFLHHLSAPQIDDNPTVSQLLDGYTETKDGAAKSRYIRASRPLKRHLGWVKAEEMLPSHTVTYAKKRNAEGIQNGTIRNELQKLSATLNWALGEKMIKSTPTIHYPKAPKPKDRWLTREEARLLVEGCRAPHIRLFVILALCTAARKGAILDLTWDRVYWDRRQIDLSEEDDDGDERKPRAVIPIADMLYEPLREAHEASQTRYVIEYGNAGVGQIENGFRAAVRRAGLKNVSPHDLRRTAATWMAMDGVEMRKISLYLGHSSVAITERVYAKYSPDYLTKAAESLKW